MTKKGWYKESARHSLAARGLKTRPRMNVMPKSSPKSLDIVTIEDNNWSVESTLDGKNATLRMDDHIGWRWDGDETSWDIFIIRMAKSGVAKDFIKSMNLSGIEYNDIKKIVTGKDYDLESAVYSMSGDNVFWHFGETGDREYEQIKSYAEDKLGISREYRDEFTEYFWMKSHINISDFDEFKGSDLYKETEKSIRDSFKKCNSWEGLMDEFSSEDWAYTRMDVQDRWVDSKLYPEVERVGKMWAKEHPKEMRISKVKRDPYQKKIGG